MLGIEGKAILRQKGEDIPEMGNKDVQVLRKK